VLPRRATAYSRIFALGFTGDKVNLFKHFSRRDWDFLSQIACSFKMSGLVAYGSSDEEDVTEQISHTSRTEKVYGLSNQAE
jgi:hypothetical protein